MCDLQHFVLYTAPRPPPRLQCYNVEASAPLTAKEAETLSWLLRETYEPELLTADSRFGQPAGSDAVVEVCTAAGSAVG